MRRAVLSVLSFPLRSQLLMGMMLFSPVWGAAQSIIISEVADPGDVYQARYVEIHNPSSTAVDISGWEIRRYANGNTTSCDAIIPGGTTLPSGGTYTIAYDASSFSSEYPCSADLESGCITGNGDDTYELVDDGGTTIDVYGEVGVDGSGEPWEYEDAIATRDPSICSGNSTWTSSEWNIIDPGNTGDATPCGHTSNCGCSHSISGFTPSEACPDSGETMTIDGSGFTNGSGTSDVIIGGNTIPSSDFTVLSDSEIQVLLDSASSGLVEVVTDACTTSSSGVFTASCPECAELFLNEFSNGDQGVREFAEFVVGNSCGECSSDLRGWIIDDNNGTFSSGTGTGNGIAQGHLRFADVAAWENIPTGSIVLVYNDGDPNNTISANLSDDPYDGNGDSLYVIPASNTDLEECGDIPNSSDGTYSPCSYISASSWGPIGMSNSQDAMQSRYPDATYFHGASYGNDVDFDGGPDGLHVHNSSGSGDVFYFDGSDPRAVGDWVTGAATDDLNTTDETPGEANSATNGNWIDGLKCSVLPIELVEFDAEAERTGNRIRWVSATEEHHDRYILQKSVDGRTYRDLASVKGKGNGSGMSRYQVLDRDAGALSYYRLLSIDRDGKRQRFGPILVRRENEGFELRQDGEFVEVLLPSDRGGELRVLDLQGRPVKEYDTRGRNRVRFGLQDCSSGMYILQYRSIDGWTHSERLIR